MKKSLFWNAVIAVFVFLLTYQVGDILKFAGVRNVLHAAEFSITVNIVQILLCGAGISAVYRVGLRNTLRHLGIIAPVGRAWIFSILATLPMVIAFIITFRVSLSVSFLSFLAFGLLSPFAEELVFRGYIFRQLYRRAGLGFWPAAILPSVLFGLGHIYQASAIWDVVGIVAITGIGSLFFCWVFIRWQDNLWVPFGLHCLMNSVWMIFSVDDTALGGWVANLARLSTVIAAILLTVYKDRIWARLAIEDENIAWVGERSEQGTSISERALIA